MLNSADSTYINSGEALSDIFEAVDVIDGIPCEVVDFAFTCDTDGSFDEQRRGESDRDFITRLDVAVSGLACSGLHDLGEVVNSHYRFGEVGWCLTMAMGLEKKATILSQRVASLKMGLTLLAQILKVGH